MAPLWFFLGGGTLGDTDWLHEELLQRLLDITGQPSDSPDLSAARAWQFLTDAQFRVAYQISQHIPWTNYAAPELLETADAGVGALWKLPEDGASRQKEWMGRIEVYDRLTDPPLGQGQFYDECADYCLEGPYSIRLVQNRTRTWSGGAPYVRYMKKPGVIDTSRDPEILPKDARAVVVLWAAARWARRAGGRDPWPYEEEGRIMLWGDPEMGYGGIIPSYKLQDQGQGHSSGPWWRSSDLGRYGY